MDLYELSKSLISKKAAQEILANFLPLLNQVKMDENRLAARYEDRISKEL